MKHLFITASLFITLANVATAARKDLSPCHQLQLKRMKQTISEKKAEGLVNVKLMKNSSNQTVGLYAWDKTGNSIFSEVCEYLSDAEQTVANTWYYWEGDKNQASPKTWKKNDVQFLQQDEGSATLTTLKESPTGDVTVKIEIEGVDEVRVKAQVLKFANP